MTTPSVQPLPGRRPVYAVDPEADAAVDDSQPSTQTTGQPHSEPLPVPGNSRVDSAPDADDPDIDPARV